MKPAREQPGVQRDMVHLRETKGDMLCLYALSSPTHRSYRAVLGISPINLSLKAEDEQEAIIERFGALIRSLSFPVQILVRNQRLDLVPYIKHLLAQPGAGGQHPSTWYALAASLAQLLQQIAARRTLIERHVYIVIPASQGASSSRRRSGFTTLFGKRRAQRILNGQADALVQQFQARVDVAYQEILEELSQEDADLVALSRTYQQVRAQDYFHSALGTHVSERLMSARGGFAS